MTGESGLWVQSEIDLDAIAAEVERIEPALLVVDSIQTLFSSSIDAAPGSVTQVRECGLRLLRLAKDRGMPVLLIGHVTKDGAVAGPRTLEHMVDAVLYLEGDRHHEYRILSAAKNRFGSTHEIGVFEMGDAGLSEVKNPSALFLNTSGERAAGAAVFAGIEGSRPVLVEIQALVAPSAYGTPRRAVVGWDGGRLAMILAVLEARCGVRFGDRDVYLNVAGGLRISELANARLENLNLEEGLVRVTGKGNKTRLVPVGRKACAAIAAYLEQERPKLVRRRSGSEVFLSARGGRLTTVRIWQIVKAVARRSGVKANVYPHLLRHSFATHLLGTLPL